MRTIVILSIVLLLVPLTPVPSVAAQGSDGLIAGDPTGDVAATVPTEDGKGAEETPATMHESLADPVDLVEARIYGISPTEFWIGFSVADFRRPDVRALGSLSYSVCFTWSGTEAGYRLVVDMAYPLTAGAGTTTEPRFNTMFFDRLDGECDPYMGIGPETHVARVATQDVQPVFDIDAGTFDARIPRLAMGSLTADDEPGPVPSEGDTFGGLQAHAVASQGKNDYLYDSLASDATVTLDSDTGNSVVRLLAPSSVPVAYGLQSYGVPIYGVEVGTFQTIPLTLENTLEAPFDARLDISVVSGDEDAWDARLISRLPVKAGSEEAPAAETITVVVNADAEMRHKDKVRLLITATDPDHPGVLGATLLDVVAVEPPLAGDSTFFFHGTGHPCNTQERWSNTLKKDRFGEAERVEIKECLVGGDGGTSLGLSGGSLAFRPDIPFGRDYWLNTRDQATASVGLTSLVRAPGGEHETTLQSVVDVTVQLLAGSTVVGEETMTDQTIPGTVDFTIDVEDLTFGNGERFVSAEDPFGVRFVVQTQDRTFEVCNAQCPPGTQRDVHIPGPSGRIFMDLTSTQVTFPVARSERAGDIINITESGALVSMRQAEQDAPRQVFTNPGKGVVFNMTVRNEGVNLDTAAIGVELNQTGWDVEVLPRERYSLAVGESATFNVRVVAPEGAKEGDSVAVRVTATSEVDPDAQATVPLSVKVTTGTILDSEDVSDDVRAASLEEKDTPSGLLVPLGALLGVALWAARRRRTA